MSTLKTILQFFGALMVYAIILALIIGVITLMIYDFSMFAFILICFALFRLIWWGTNKDLNNDW